MVDMTRCFNCRGQKKVPGLGGVVKDCLACKGGGLVEVDITKPMIDQPIENVVSNPDNSELIERVSKAVSTKVEEPKKTKTNNTKSAEKIKIEKGKRKIFKRKAKDGLDNGNA